MKWPTRRVKPENDLCNADGGGTKDARRIAKLILQYRRAQFGMKRKVTHVFDAHAVQFLNARKSTTEYDHIRIQNTDQSTERSAEIAKELLHGRLAFGIACAKAGDNVGHAQGLARAPLVSGLHAAAA